MSRLENLENKLSNWTSANFVYTPVIGLGRSMLAIGTLLTLLTNRISYLMPQLADGTILNPLLNPLAPINEFNFFLLLGFENIIIMKWLAIIILVIVIAGFLPQITSIFHWWISFSFIFFSSAIDGGDQMAAVFTFLLLPLCITDPRRNHWEVQEKTRQSPVNLFGILSYWLIRLQVAVIYLHAASGKFIVEEWMNGTALYYWFSHSIFGMQDWLSYITMPLLSNNFIVTIMTYSVLILELILFLALTMPPKYRMRIFPVALAFHFMIILYHGIFSFFFSIGAGLVFYLVTLQTEKVKNLKWVKIKASSIKEAV